MLKAEITPDSWVARALRGRLGKATSPSSSLLPGSLFSLVIGKITGLHVAGCGACGRRKAQMNAWGWWGCWRNRNVIIGWLCEEAGKRGHIVSNQAMLGLLRAAFKELRNKA